ncbi:MAG: alpha/beta hydrolase [Desulfurococcaceae archaeon]
MREDFIGSGRCRCRVILERGVRPPVVLLHGYSFTSDVWRDVGLLQALEGMGIPYVAIDMPYGRISRCSAKSRDVELNQSLVEEAVRGILGGQAPLVIGASLGGYHAVLYSLRNRALGLVLVAPVNVSGGEVLERAKLVRPRTLVIYGDRDDVVDLAELRPFVDAVGAELKVYRGAGHAAYLDRPREFVEDVIAFYKHIAGSGT